MEDDLIKEAKKAIKQAEWANKMAEELLPLIEKDIQGTINLGKKTNKKTPFFSVKRNEKGQVYMCCYITKNHCATCIFNLGCLVK